MAAPITHIVLALKMLCLLPSTVNKQEFLVGTSFPDIRYMAHLGRTVTHLEPVSWEAVVNEPSAFRAGMLFHNLVDVMRIKHFEYYFYDRSFADAYTARYREYYPLVMKAAEDALLYDFTTQWDEVISCFNTVCDKEKAFCADESVIKKWHCLLQNYFRQKTTPETLDAFLQQDEPFDLFIDELNCDVRKIFNDLLDNQDFKGKLNYFYATFDELLWDEHQSVSSEIGCVA